MVAWHQDRGYWTAVDRAEMITGWVALAPVTEEMGAMRFVDGSHRWGRVIEGNGFFETDADAQIAAAAIPDGETWTEATTDLAPGQATFHTCRTVHGSPPNRATVPRVGIAVHFISAQARRVPGKWHANNDWAAVPEGEPWSVESRIPRVWPALEIGVAS